MRLYRPKGASATARVPGIVMIHGGGFVIGSVEAEHAGAALMAMDTGAVVVSVEYRLAPEHPYPAGSARLLRRAALPARRGGCAGRGPGAGGTDRGQRRWWPLRRRRRSSPVTGAARPSASSCWRSPSSTTGSRRRPCRRSWTRPCGTGRWPCRAGRRISVRSTDPTTCRPTRRRPGPRTCRGCRRPTSRPPRTTRCATRGSSMPSACCRPASRWSCTSSPAPSTVRRW